MKKNMLIVISSIIFFFSFPGTIFALPISSGSEVYTSDFGDFTATLYYEVYAPNDPSSPLYGLIGSDEYAYIYRISNDPGSLPDWGNINKFNLGYESGIDIINFGTIDDGNPATVAPSGYVEQTTQFVFLFLGASQILPGSSSQEFYVTALGAPAPESPSSMVGSGGDTANVFLQNAGPGPALAPVPEPTTLILMGFGLLGLYKLKRKKI